MKRAFIVFLAGICFATFVLANKKEPTVAEAAKDVYDALKRKEQIVALTPEFLTMICDARERWAMAALEEAKTPEERWNVAEAYLKDMQGQVARIEARIAIDADDAAWRIARYHAVLAKKFAEPYRAATQPAATVPATQAR